MIEAEVNELVNILKGEIEQLLSAYLKTMPLDEETFENRLPCSAKGQEILIYDEEKI